MAEKFKKNSLLGNRIRENRERLNLTRPELAKAIGVSLSALQSWEANEREPQASMIITIANELKISPNYLLTGDEEQAKNIVDEYVTMIPSYSSINVSAGFGSFNEGVTRPDGEEPYSDSLLQTLRVKPNQCAVFWANGDSMTPTISNGDQLLVDLTKTEVRGDNKIYLVQNGSSVWVKRVKQSWNSVELISDNKEEYEPIVLTEDETEYLQIIGQVVHIGHSLI